MPMTRIVKDNIMKKLSFIIMILACASLLSACAKTEQQKETYPITSQTEPTPSLSQEAEVASEPTKAPEINPIDTVTQSNYNNDYLFLESGGWIYGRSWNDKGESVFVKVRTDLTDWTTLAEKYAVYPHLVDNYLYFVGYSEDEHGIYRMRTSGEDFQLIVNNAVWLQVVDDTMYYIDDADHGLYRCSLDSSNSAEVISDSVYYPFVFSDFIMYQNDTDNSRIHICDLSGKNDRAITDTYSFYPTYDGEYVYYVAGMENDTKRTIRKVRIDGTEDQEVAPYACYMGFIVQNDYLYFVYADDDDRLYRMKKYGTGIELVTQDENVLFPQFFGTGLKYTVYSSGYEYVDKEFFCRAGW
jgi:hypothetical protein